MDWLSGMDVVSLMGRDGRLAQAIWGEIIYMVAVGQCIWGGTLPELLRYDSRGRESRVTFKRVSLMGRDDRLASFLCSLT